MNRTCSWITPSKNRAGTTLTELVVAAGLLVTVVGLTAGSVGGVARLYRLEQQHRVAVDELSNQLERLTQLTADQARSELEEIELSKWASISLSGGQLSGEVLNDSHGTRVQLSIQWNRLGPAKPLVAVAWLTQEPSPQLGEIP